MILSFKAGTTQEECKEFMNKYWVPLDYEFNIDTQIFEVALRPFDKMKD